MPLVYIHHRTDGEYPKIAAKLARLLPAVVAANLSMHEDQSQDWFEVDPKTVRTMLMPASPHDVNPFDIGIIIWAHNFPARIATGMRRESRIRESVKGFVAGKATGFVTLNLIHMEVGTF
jgi:hypothetical protein